MCPFGAHVLRRGPPCARRCNKEYLLNSLPTIESSIPAFHGITTNKRFCTFFQTSAAGFLLFHLSNISELQTLILEVIDDLVYKCYLV